MPRIIRIACLLCFGMGVAACAQREEPKVVKISDSVYVATVTGNVYLVTTPAGNVVIDTATANDAPQARKLLGAVSQGPVKYIILTHGHADHIGGINLWKEAGTQIIAQRNYVEFVNYVTRLEEFFAPRNAAAFGGSPKPVGPWAGNFGAKIAPTIFFDDKYSFTLGGVEFDLFSTPGETPDHLTVWLPAQKIAFIGDNYKGAGLPEPMSFPNLYAIRGTKPRWALDWIGSIDRVLALKPEVVLSGHGDPINGNAEITRLLTRYRNAIQYVHDEVVLDAVAARLKAQDPSGESGFGATLQSVGDVVNGTVKPVLLLLMGAVAFVLLIACSNVANLLLSRSAARQREISIRTALGASRWRVIRQLLTESVLLALLGGGFGLALAEMAIRLLRLSHPSSVPASNAIVIDPAVLAYAALLCGVVGVLCGLAPAWEGSKGNVSETLKEGSRGSSGSFGSHRAMMVITETALASMLLIGAGLSLRSLWHAEMVSLGFNPEGELTFRVAAPAQLFEQRIPLFYHEVLERLRALPGVQSAVLARNLPMSGTDPSMPISIEGVPPPASEIPIVARLRAVGPDYFSGLQTSLLKGREFTEHDTAASPRVVVVSESLAKLYWPNENALGKRLKPGMPGGDWCVVVGVASDVHHWAADVDIEPTAYYPYSQVPSAFLPLLEDNMSIAVRSQNSAGLLSSIRAALADVDKSVPMYDLKSMEEMVAESGSLRRLNMWLIGAFAGLALTLAAIGIYGVIAYGVSQRTREIGIRIALGAQPRDVLRLILAQGAKLALAGVIAGLVGAFMLSSLMSSLLFGVSPRDVATFSIVPWIVLALVLIGCYIPARRATTVDPVVALRYE